MSLSEKSHINNYSHPEVVTFPLGEVLEPETQPQSQQIMTVRYFGHMDETTTTDTLYYTLHTPEGYITLDALHRVDSWNYFRRDHLGNKMRNRKLSVRSYSHYKTYKNRTKPHFFLHSPFFFCTFARFFE